MITFGSGDVGCDGVTDWAAAKPSPSDKSSPSATICRTSLSIVSIVDAQASGGAEM